MRSNAPDQGQAQSSVLDRLHEALAAEKRISSYRAQAEAARPKPRAKIEYKSNNRSRTIHESLLASEKSPRNYSADGSPILQAAEPPWRREATPAVW